MGVYATCQSLIDERGLGEVGMRLEACVRQRAVCIKRLAMF